MPWQKESIRQFVKFAGTSAGASSGSVGINLLWLLKNNSIKINTTNPSKVLSTFLKKAKFWIVLNLWCKGNAELVRQQTTKPCLWNPIEDFAPSR